MKSEETTSKTALIFTLILLICSLSINIWLKKENEYIKKSFKKCTNDEAIFDYSITRTKRDIHLEITKHDGDYFLPLYTHLNPKEIDKLCANRYDMVHQNQNQNIVELTNDVTFRNLKLSEENKKKEKNRTKLKSNRSKKLRGKHFGNKMPKSCPLISSLFEPFQLGSRLYQVGSALRFDDKIFVTEYSMGYMLFEYNLTSDAENALNVPEKIFTLPMPFSGTDHAIVGFSGGQNIFFYQIASTNSILSYDLKSDKSVQFQLENLTRKPLFKHSASQIDFEFDDGNLFIIFKSKNSTGFTILKFEPLNLKQLDKFYVEIFFTDDIINSFVSCNVFYLVRLQGEIAVIEPVFDLRKKSALNSLNAVPSFDDSWKPIGIPANVQFDEKSESLTAFDHGQIYSMLIKRK